MGVHVRRPRRGLWVEGVESVEGREGEGMELGEGLLGMDGKERCEGDKQDHGYVMGS